MRVERTPSCHFGLRMRGSQPCGMGRAQRVVGERTESQSTMTTHDAIIMRTCSTLTIVSGSLSGMCKVEVVTNLVHLTRYVRAPLVIVHTDLTIDVCLRTPAKQSNERRIKMKTRCCLCNQERYRLSLQPRKVSAIIGNVKHSLRLLTYAIQLPVVPGGRHIMTCNAFLNVSPYLLIAAFWTAVRITPLSTPETVFSIVTVPTPLTISWPCAAGMLHSHTSETKTQCPENQR